MLRANATHLFKALLYSLDGLATAFKNEMAFRQEALLTAVSLPILYFLNFSAALKFVLFGLLLLLLAVEAMNSAIEKVVDRISTERHPDSKAAKDLGSAAVFLTIILNGIAWVYALFFAG